MFYRSPQDMRDETSGCGLKDEFCCIFIDLKKDARLFLFSILLSHDYHYFGYPFYCLFGFGMAVEKNNYLADFLDKHTSHLWVQFSWMDVDIGIFWTKQKPSVFWV